MDEPQAAGDRRRTGNRRGTAGRPGAAAEDQGRPRQFRSQLAVLIWWVWLLFAVANLIDLAVQGRDHASAIAAAALLLGTGIAYVTALRPRVIADDEGIVVRNPLRDHRVGWPTVARVDLDELLRVRCEWRESAGRSRDRQYSRWRRPDGLVRDGLVRDGLVRDGLVRDGLDRDGLVRDPQPGKLRRKVIHAWAVQASRRRIAAAELKMRSAVLRSAGAGSSGRTRPDSLDHMARSGHTVRTTRAFKESASVPPGVVHLREVEQSVSMLNERAASARERAAAAHERDASSSESSAQYVATAAPVASWSPESAAALVLPALLLIIVILV